MQARIICTVIFSPILLFCFAFSFVISDFIFSRFIHSSIHPTSWLGGFDAIQSGVLDGINAKVLGGFQVKNVQWFIPLNKVKVACGIALTNAHRTHAPSLTMIAVVVSHRGKKASTHKNGIACDIFQKNEWFHFVISTRAPCKSYLLSSTSFRRWVHEWKIDAIEWQKKDCWKPPLLAHVSVWNSHLWTQKRKYMHKTKRFKWHVRAIVNKLTTMTTVTLQHCRSRRGGGEIAVEEQKKEWMKRTIKWWPMKINKNLCIHLVLVSVCHCPLCPFTHHPSFVCSLMPKTI